MIASAITSRKRVTRPCRMTSPLRQALAVCPEGVNIIPDHLRTLVLAFSLALAQAARATTTIMLTKTITSQVQPLSMGIHPSMGIRTPRMTMKNITIAQTKTILTLPPYPLQRRRRRSTPRNTSQNRKRLVLNLNDTQ